MGTATASEVIAARRTVFPMATVPGMVLTGVRAVVVMVKISPGALTMAFMNPT